jgi:isocitrate lyase
MNSNRNGNPEQLARSWTSQPRWTHVTRPYRAEDVIHLRGTLKIEYTLARRGAERLWRLLYTRRYLPALGALTGNQAVQMVQAGLEAIYCSGWQVAADANLSGEMHPDLGLYPSISVPLVVRRINSALQRADIDWFVPIVADGEAGFGGNLNVFELTKQMIDAGAAGIHFEDQLSSAKKCGHMGGKVLVPMREFIEKLVAARLAADVLGVPTVICARTDADSAALLTSDIDERDEPFLTGRRTPEGLFEITGGQRCAIARGLAYAPYADVIWCETSRPDLERAREFAEAIGSRYPDKLLAYNCSPSFNWRDSLDDVSIARFQRELGAMGYRFQFVTLAGFHALNVSMFELAQAYRREGMVGYARLQEREFELQQRYGYSAVKHQRFVGAGYFDEIATVVSNGATSVAAMKGSTEEQQFDSVTARRVEAEPTEAEPAETETRTGPAEVTIDRIAAPEEEPAQTGAS